jgi:7-cyano-7-deazaguanine synthase in queuosine biosynthesis
VKVCALVTGGVDSVITYHLLLKDRKDDEIIPVFVNLKQAYVDKELKASLRIFGDKLNVLNVDNNVQGQGQNWFIPNRNLFLASYTTMVHAPDEIYLGGLAEDAGTADLTPEVFSEMSALISKTSKKDIAIKSLLWEYTKGQAIEMFVSQNIPNAREIIEQTVSCYDGTNAGQCNNCIACFHRYVALASNGFDVEPLDDAIIETYKETFKLDELHIDFVERATKLGLYE